MKGFARKLSPCTRRKHEREIDGQDRVNQLPDEILILILSRMTMKEAAQTSVISRRWEKLWTFHPCLDFDGSQTVVKIRPQDHRYQEYLNLSALERARFVDWVNHVVEYCHLSAPVIDEFRVFYDLDESYKCDIDEWVRFAFEKKVKVFELSLVDFTGIIKDRCYPLCLQTLCLPSFIPLTSLVLKGVNVSDDVIANFLSNSPFLEHLCVEASKSLIHLRLVGPSLYLKYVEIFHCVCFETLEIDADNLLSLKYVGQKEIKIRSMRVPNLSELVIGTMGLKYLTREILWKSEVYSRLQKLSIRMHYVEKWMKKHEYTMFSQLKELTLRLSTRDDESLLFFSSLINACPSLNRFSLELVSVTPDEKRKIKKARKTPHHSLKVVEITGFQGETTDTEFCMYLIENAIMLEKIIIHHRILPYEWHCYHGEYPVEMVKAARERAEQLRSKYFLGDKLVFT